MGKWTKYKKRFSIRWEKDDELKEWIERVPNDDTKAFCRYCKKKIRAHRYGLVIHANTEKHRRNEADAYFSDTGDLFKNEKKDSKRNTISDATIKVAKDSIPIVKASGKSLAIMKQEKLDSLTWPRVILFGDSLTQFSFSEGGWGSMLSDMLQRKCDVLNRGFSGYNSRWSTMILPRLFPDAQSIRDITAFIIFLGANDSNRQELNPQQHVPAVEYSENLQAMVLHLQSVGLDRKRIILIGPPACDTLSWETVCTARGVPMAKDNEIVSVYNSFCMEAASACGVQFIDLYTPMMSISNWPSYLMDGLHLSKEGSKFVYEQLVPHINELTCSLPQLLPEWRTVDNKNPAAVLNSV